MQIDCGSWIRWLVSRIRSCADKLGGGWARYKQERTAKCHDDDRRAGLRLLVLAAVYFGSESASPTDEQTSNDKEKEARFENTRQLCVV